MNQKDLLRPVADAASLSAPLDNFNTADAVEYLNALPLPLAANTLAALLALNFPEAGPNEIEVLMYAALVLMFITLVVNVIGSMIMMYAQRGNK